MLDDRSLFLRLVDAGSFAKTARLLGIARSTVMRRLDCLETELGCTLFQRVNRHLVLTEAGKEYANAIRPVLKQLQEVEEQITGKAKKPVGNLRLWLPILGTSVYLAPALADFHKQYPAIKIQLELGKNIRQLELGDFDVALQIGSRINTSMMVRTLHREKLILIAHKDYVSSSGVPETTEDLANHALIYQCDVEGKRLAWRWPDGKKVTMHTPIIEVNSVGFAFELAKSGIGIVRIPSLLIASEPSPQEWVQVLPDIWTEEPVNLIYLPKPKQSTRIFLEFMANWFQQRFS